MEKHMATLEAQLYAATHAPAATQAMDKAIQFAKATAVDNKDALRQEGQDSLGKAHTMACDNNMALAGMTEAANKARDMHMAKEQEQAKNALEQEQAKNALEAMYNYKNMGQAVANKETTTVAAKAKGDAVAQASLQMAKPVNTAKRPALLAQAPKHIISDSYTHSHVWKHVQSRQYVLTVTQRPQ